MYFNIFNPLVVANHRCDKETDGLAVTQRLLRLQWRKHGNSNKKTKMDLEAKL